MLETESLLTFLADVRRRFITSELLRNGMTALVCGLAGLVVLLLAGTQIFDWYWPVSLFAAAAIVGYMQFRRHMPDRYRIAQIADRRLGLDDTLSTALNFLPASGSLVEWQRERAGRLAATLSAKDAVPVKWPRTSYAAAALALTAFTILGVRYGILHTLDLSAPVSEAMVDVFRFWPSEEKRKLAGRRPDDISEELKKLGLSIDDGAKDEVTKIEQAKEGEITTSDIPDVNDLSDVARGEKAKSSTDGKGANEGDPGGKGGEGEKESEDGNPGDPDQKGRPDSKQAAKDGKQGQKGGEQGSQQGQNSSMLDKMKDAFANMMNKLKQSNQDEGQKQAANQKGGEKSGAQQKGGQQGGKQPGKGENAQNGAEQPGDAADAAEKQANAQGQSGDKSAAMQAPPDAKSGVGKADGDKSIKEAQQLQAMGKISEILGKRAKDISGEVMVEVNGGRQQLRTQYGNNAARHAESGGEIHRDEVPLRHQAYVRQYFEEVRKQAAPAAPKQ